MTTFDKREEGFEKKFALDEEQKFKAHARRNRLLGVWAAEKLGISGDAATAYGRNLPDMVILTRSPLGLGSRSMTMSKSIADMMPSPYSSSISAFHAGPLTMTSS